MCYIGYLEAELYQQFLLRRGDHVVADAFGVIQIDISIVLKVYAGYLLDVSIGPRQPTGAY